MSTTNQKTYKFQSRVCFGEETPLHPDLAGLRVVEYFITADDMVPLHIYVASREKFRCVIADGTRMPSRIDTVQIVNGDGRMQEFALTEFTISIQSESQNIRWDWFPCEEYNDTAFVFFGGNDADDDKDVRCAAVRGALMTWFQAYERFAGYAGLVGPAYRENMVPWKECPPTTMWKSSFAKDVCSHQHALMMWANSPVQETASLTEDGVVRFTDADGHSMSMIHRRPGNADAHWKMCSLQFHDALPEQLGFQMAMPFALTAPFQVSFPGCVLPGEAAAMQRYKRTLPL